MTDAIYDHNRAVALECVFYYHALRRLGFTEKDVSFDVAATNRVVVKISAQKRVHAFTGPAVTGPVRLFVDALRAEMTAYVEDARPYLAYWPQSRPFKLFAALLDNILDKGFVVSPTTIRG